MEKMAVLLHGYPAEKRQSTPVRELLEKMGYKVLAPKYMECQEKFSISWFRRELKKEIGDGTVEVIIGVSLGGMILPYLVRDYPKAKLIFIATAARFKPKMKLVSGTVKMVSKNHSVEMMKLIKKLPEGLLKEIYNVVYKAKTEEDKKLVEADKIAIIEAIRVIHPNKHQEMANFILKTDNRKIISKIKNPTLVIAAEHDVLMPTELGRELGEGIKGSIFKLIPAEHYNILAGTALREVEKFLSG